MKFKFSACHQDVISVLRATREKAGIGQRELSLKLGRVYNYANLVEKGQRLQNICEFLDYVRGIGADAAEVVREIEDLGRHKGRRSSYARRPVRARRKTSSE